MVWHFFPRQLSLLPICRVVIYPAWPNKNFRANQNTKSAKFSCNWPAHILLLCISFIYHSQSDRGFEVDMLGLRKLIFYTWQNYGIQIIQCYNTSCKIFIQKTLRISKSYHTHYTYLRVIISPQVQTWYVNNTLPTSWFDFFFCIVILYAMSRHLFSRWITT